MSSMILINQVRLGSSVLQSGSSYDSVSEAATITKIKAEGGVLVPLAVMGQANADAAQAMAKRGGLFKDDGGAALLLLAALAAIGASQSVQGIVLVAGTKTVNTGITITAKSIILPTLRVPGGTMGARLKIDGIVVGDPGTGAFVLTAVDTAGVLVNTDTSTYDVVIIG
jgi:hypothetical protein